MEVGVEGDGGFASIREMREVEVVRMCTYEEE